MNRRLPAANRIRVFAGDPPIDWRKINTREQFQTIVVHRDDFPVSLIRSQILKYGQKALIIYGGAHLRATAPMVRTLQESRPGRFLAYLINPGAEDGIELGPDPAISRDEAELARGSKIVFGHDRK